MTSSGIPVATLDALPPDDAARLLAGCCGASEWVRRMVASRPFADRATLLLVADRVWMSLTPADWRETFDHHPHIGDGRTSAPVGATANAWSSDEQAQAARSDASERAALSDAQQEYEARFGHIFLVCASGRTSGELLANLRSRLHNAPDEELRIAAEEQRKITRLRLERLITDDAGGPP